MGRKQPTNGAEDFAGLTELALLLGDPLRLRLLLLLGEGERHVSELQEATGQPQPTVSHHLGILRRTGLVQARREGKHVFYSLKQPPPGPGVLRLPTRDGSAVVEVRLPGA